MAKHKLAVVLVAGHNSAKDGGNPVERALTDDLARAYLAAFKSADIPVQWINPTVTTFSGLDALASGTAKAIRDADAELVLALDLHFNGSNSGVHTIPPHNRNSTGDQLSTAIVAGRVAADVMENNPLDVRLAEAYSKAIVAAVDGMYLWGANGVMPESQTGVGLKGFRLAMPAYSAPYRAKAVRVTIEHGGTNDAQRPDFFNKCAKAVLAATKTVLADRLESGTPSPDPDPETPPQGGDATPTLTAFLFGSADGYSYDENGPVSKLWLKTGNENHLWPRLIDVQEIEDIRAFVFSDGSVIATTLSGKNPAYLTGPLD